MVQRTAVVQQIAPTPRISDTTQYVVVVSSLRCSRVFTEPGPFSCFGESDGHIVPDSAIHYPLSDAQGNRNSRHFCI